MKRILVYGLSPTYGGTERYFLTLIKQFTDKEFIFDFLYPYTVKEISYADEIEQRGGEIFRSYYSNSEKNISGAISIKAFFDTYPNRWDGVYVNFQSINTAYRLLEEAKKRKMPYRIAHAHNNGYPYPPRVKDKLVELYFHLTQKHVLTHRLCCSSLAGDWFFRCKGYNVIPNSIEFKRFKKSDNERYRRRMELGLSDKSFVVGFCGRLVEQKNPLFVIDIFKEIHNKNSNAILLIVGDGRLREEINDRVQQYELSNAVILCGAVNDVENYLSAMDVFLLPSRFEGFGISLLEAQAAGLECYTSEKVVPTETNITNHVNFLSLKDSAETWADAILTGNIAHYDEFEKLENSNYSLTNLRKLFIEAIQM